MPGERNAVSHVKRFGTILATNLLLAAVALAQGPDSARISIHQLEAEGHRWDVLRTDSVAPSLQRGKEYAVEGEYAEAEKQFRKALRRKRADALFDLGVVHLYQDKLDESLRFFRRSNAVKPDSLCREQIHEIERRIRERGKVKDQ